MLFTAKASVGLRKEWKLWNSACRFYCCPQLLRSVSEFGSLVLVFRMRHFVVRFSFIFWFCVDRSFFRKYKSHNIHGDQHFSHRSLVSPSSTVASLNNFTAAQSHSRVCYMQIVNCSSGLAGSASVRVRSHRKVLYVASFTDREITWFLVNNEISHSSTCFLTGTCANRLLGPMHPKGPHTP